MKKILASLAAVSALAVVSVYAGTPDDSVGSVQPVVVDQGFFVTANVGGGASDFDDYDLSNVGGVSTGGFAWNVGAGYQFNQYIAGEVDYMWLPSITGDGSFKLRTNLIDFLAKGMYPITQQLDIFAKMGLGIAFGSLTFDGNSGGLPQPTTSAVGVFGAGADYYFTPNVGADAQFLYTTDAEDNGIPHSYTGLVGITYKFF